MPHILEMSEDHIENHLRMTGQTREELEARYKAERERDMPEDFDESDWVQGCDPRPVRKYSPCGEGAF